MNCKYWIWSILLSVWINHIYAQESTNIQDFIESVADNLPENTDLSILQERLMYYQKHPIDLNHTHAEELNELIFLNALQINNLLLYVQQYGPLYDIAELQVIDGFDPAVIYQMQPFVKVSADANYQKINIDNILKYSDNSWINRLSGNFQPKVKNYEGGNLRFTSRYNFDFDKRIQLNFTLDKDAGEKWWAKRNALGFDFSSGSLAFQNIGSFQKIVLGDYHLQFGQGLVLWTGFATGINPDILSIAKKEIGLRAYTSVTEFGFFRGFATTLKFNKIKITPFVSYQKIDASLSLNSDAILIKSIPLSGYHRTTSEINNRNSSTLFSVGNVLEYQYRRINLGLIAQYLKFQYPFERSDNLYKLFQSTDNEQTNGSIFYNYTFRNMYIFGETALQQYRNFATLNGLLISISKYASLSVLYRKYAPAYQAFYAQAISENTRNENENGLFLGFDFTPINHLKISTYADYFDFPWLKYRVDAPSQGNQFFIQGLYQINKTNAITLRYRMRNKAINNTNSLYFNEIENINQKNIRLQGNWALPKSLSFQSRIEWTQVKQAQHQENGYLLAQDIDYKLNSTINLSSRVAYFHTDSYDSRIYAYEDNVLYNATFSAYQGKGIRFYVNSRWKINKKIDFWLRYSFTKSVDNQDFRNDFTSQFRYQF